jgi:hypothetical protein
VLVEEPVGGQRPSLVAAGEHLVILDRRGRDLAVPEPLEGLRERRLEAPQLAHLVGQHVPGPRGNAKGHDGHLTHGGQVA